MQKNVGEETGARFVQMSRSEMEAEILRLLAERDALEAKLEEAYQYALHFADAFTMKHFPKNTGWKPFDDLLGLLTQIDNMTTVLQAKLDEAQTELREARMQAISDGCELQEAMEAQGWEGGE